MNFRLIRPCEHCPFRTNISGYLHKDRARQIAEFILSQDKTFACHETTGDKPGGGECKPKGADVQHCAGALIMHELNGKPNWLIRFAHEIGLYDPEKLDMTAPVCSTVDQMVAIHRKGD